MMKSNEVYQALESIGATSSKNEKQAMVKEYAHDLDFRKVLVLAYDPFITFGIAAVPNRTTEGPDGLCFTDDGVAGPNTWEVLDLLANRSLTGNAARLVVQEEINRLDIGSSDLFRRILKKDLRAGFSENTINKAVKGLISDFPYMRCCLPKDAKLDQFDWAGGVISQEKADGMFANISFEESGNVTITSRQGKPFPLLNFQHLTTEIHLLLKPGNQYHGELLIERNGVVLPREQSNGIFNSLSQGGEFGVDERPIYHVWDVIPLSAVVSKGKYEVPYVARLASLVMMLKEDVSVGTISLVPTRVVHSLAEAYIHYGELVKAGKEGSIIKDRKAIWRDGVNKSCVKLKLEVDVDLVITDFLSGTGKNEATFGSITCRTADAGLSVAVTGFSDLHRGEIWSQRSDLVGSIMTVKANAIMYPSKVGEQHSLFLPRFVEFRTDKTQADTLQQVIDQFEAAVKAA